MIVHAKKCRDVSGSAMARQGFTLIELLVVIAIIAILMVLVTVTRAQRVNAAMAAVRTLFPVVLDTLNDPNDPVSLTAAKGTSQQVASVASSTSLNEDAVIQEATGEFIHDARELVELIAGNDGTIDEAELKAAAAWAGVKVEGEISRPVDVSEVGNPFTADLLPDLILTLCDDHSVPRGFTKALLAHTNGNDVCSRTLKFIETDRRKPKPTLSDAARLQIKIAIYLTMQ